MKNLLYIVPNIERINGGPVSRITDFKKEFNSNGDLIISNNKISKALATKKLNVVYVESATNRIGFDDLIALLILKIKSKKLIVFIRDIYIELFPEEYKGPRKSITRYCNQFSNYFLTLISSKLAFPTYEMGKFFFEKNKYHPKREFFELPPATDSGAIFQYEISTDTKPGILYLGGTHYVNSGFEKFIEYAELYSESYNFFVLTPDTDLNNRYKIPKELFVSSLKRNQIPDFLKENNVAVAFHTRPRNFYDDITFPIKVMDFINFGLPFLTERHKPMENLMGKDYNLFVDWEDAESVMKKTNDATIHRKVYLKKLERTAEENTYKKRFDEIIK
ncbi:MAG: hypothetical protein H3C39_01865 [Flavobacteriia bacterium]|nr:hypothetical protein [Flavobacteriia bacterium]